MASKLVSCPSLKFWGRSVQNAMWWCFENCAGIFTIYFVHVHSVADPYHFDSDPGCEQFSYGSMEMIRIPRIRIHYTGCSILLYLEFIAWYASMFDFTTTTRQCNNAFAKSENATNCSLWEP